MILQYAVFLVGFTGGHLKLLELLVKVFVEPNALHNGRVWLLELVAIETDKDDLDIIYEFINPGDVEKRPIDCLEHSDVSIWEGQSGDRVEERSSPQK